MTRLIGIAAIVLAVTSTAVAQPERPLVEELLAVYRARCESEVKVLAEQLDALNGKVLEKMPTRAAASVREAVSTAWISGLQAIALFQQLENSPRKFTRWANEAHLPAWFNVPDSVAQVRQWEGLRPILAAVTDGQRLRWDSKDTDEWQRQPGAWRLELLLLLKWLGPESLPLDPPLRSKAVAWVAEQAGADVIRSWRESPAERHEFLHAGYTYLLLRRPPVTPDCHGGWRRC